MLGLIAPCFIWPPSELPSVTPSPLHSWLVPFPALAPEHPRAHCPAQSSALGPLSFPGPQAPTASLPSSSQNTAPIS